MEQAPVAALDNGDRPPAWMPRWMVIVVSFILIFFVAATAVQLTVLYGRIGDSPKLTLPTSFGDAPLQSSQWNALLQLESHSIQQRYHMARIGMMARLWTIYIGFLTGMLLAIAGAAFILGRIREDMTKITANVGQEQSKAGGSIESQSPGMVMVACGTVLMLATLLSHRSIDVREGPVYLTGGPPQAQPAPAPFPESDAAKQDKMLEQVRNATGPAGATGQTAPTEPGGKK